MRQTRIAWTFIGIAKVAFGLHSNQTDITSLSMLFKLKAPVAPTSPPQLAMAHLPETGLELRGN